MMPRLSWSRSAASSAGLCRLSFSSLSRSAAMIACISEQIRNSEANYCPGRPWFFPRRKEREQDRNNCTNPGEPTIPDSAVQKHVVGFLASAKRNSVPRYAGLPRRGRSGNGQSCRRRCHRNQRVWTELEKPDVINSDFFVTMASTWEIISMISGAVTSRIAFSLANL